VQLKRDFMIIVLQSYNLSHPMGSDAAHFRACFVAGAPVSPDRDCTVTTQHASSQPYSRAT